LADLLYQTSGFSELDGLQMNLLPDGADELEAGVRDLTNLNLSFNPGSGWEYSNINFDTVTKLVGFGGEADLL
jgi:CubicO group peptidase (beta-lactamase class C family)